MIFDIHIDPIATLENQYKEALEKGTEPYPTLADFDVNTPLEILEQYPVIPVLVTIQKIERQSDVTPFLKLQKPITNLPENEQKVLLQYIQDLAVDFVPFYGTVKNLTGNNVHARSGPINNGIGYYLKDLGTTLIKKLQLGFTEKDIDTCQRCGDPKCSPHYQICTACNYPIFGCEYKNATYHHAMQTTCESCGETHSGCLEHVRHPDQKSCTVYRRKSPVPAQSPLENGEIVTVETRRLLRRLKQEVRDIIKEIHHQFPTLVDFHTRHPDAFLKQYPIVLATLTFLKESETNRMLFYQMRRDAKATGLKFISAIRDITAAAWGDTIADTSATALLKHLKLPFSLADIDTCEKCGDPACVGITGDCCNTEMSESGQLVLGCGEHLYACDTYHATIHTCEEPLCQKPKYRQCTEHKCEIADHTDLVHYLFELENADTLTPNAQTFVKRINALTPNQQADFVKQFHAIVDQMDPIEKTAAAVQTTLRKHGLKITF